MLNNSVFGLLHLFRSISQGPVQCKVELRQLIARINLTVLPTFAVEPVASLAASL